MRLHLSLKPYLTRSKHRENDFVFAGCLVLTVLFTIFSETKWLQSKLYKL